MFNKMIPLIPLIFAATAYGNNEPDLRVYRVDANPYLNSELSQGQILASTQSLTIELDQDDVAGLIEERAATTVVRETPDFYRERRGFSEPTLVANLRFEDGELSESLPLLAGTGWRLTVDIAPGRTLSYISLRILGQSEFFKCFDANTCVSEGVESQSISVGVPMGAIKTWQPLLSCDDDALEINQKVSDGQRYKVIINNREMREHLALGWTTSLLGVGDAADSADDFVGLAADAGYYANGFNDRGETYKRAHVFPEWGGMKVKVDVDPHLVCNYVMTDYDGRSYSSTRAVRLGQSCPGVNDSRYRLVRSYVGAQERYSREWFMRGCSAR